MSDKNKGMAQQPSYNVIGQLKWDLSGFINDLAKNCVEHNLRMSASDTRESITFELSFRNCDKELEMVAELLTKHFKTS